MTCSNDSLKFDMKYNFIRLQLSQIYLLNKINFCMNENGKFNCYKTRYISQIITCKGNLITNITCSNDYLKLYNLIRLYTTLTF